MTIMISSSKSQIVVNSTDGYSVEITINPTSLIIYGGNNCRFGYNYDFNFDYDIKIRGNNIPNNLYTLQGTIETNEGIAFFNLPKRDTHGSGKTNGRIWTSKTDCSTANLQSTPIKKITIEINGPGIVQQFIDYKTSTLPIELIDFSAKRESSNIFLTWSTATEINNDYFTLERSSNGIDFKQIAMLKGAGNSNQILNYTYSDISSEDAYYRLKQTDFDGKYSYSSILYIPSMEMNIETLSVYPNPSETNQIKFISATPEIYTLSISTITGQTLQTIELTSNNISLPELPQGFYLLQFKNEENGAIQSVKYLQK